MEDEYLHSSILDRMPFFSLESLYNDLKVWYSNSLNENIEYAEKYEELNTGEWYYEPHSNDIVSTAPMSTYHRFGTLYVTNLDEIDDFFDYCQYMNSHPIVHPIYTRILTDDGYILKYSRPVDIPTGKTTWDYNIVDSIKEIYPEFNLGYISDVISRFGFYDPNITKGLFKTVGYEYDQDVLLDEINDIYAFGPHPWNHGKGIMYSML
jgi:hypothetical protein